MTKLISLLLCIISVCSCKTEINENITNLQIGNPVKLNDFSDVFSDIELIFLESKEDSYMGRAGKIYIINDTMYIKDQKTHDIFIFGKDGSLVSNSKRIIGNSGTEVNILLDFLVNPYTNNIEILSFNSVYVYDKLFNFIEKFKIPKECVAANYFDIIDKSTYVFQTINDDGKTAKDQSILYIYSKNDDKMINKVYFDEVFPIGTIGTDDTNIFFKNSTETFFMSRMNHHSLFSLNLNDNDLLKHEYNLNLINNPVTKDDINVNNRSEFWESASANHSIFNKRYISDKYIAVSYFYKNKLKIYIYNQETKKSICFNNIFDSGNMISPPNIITNDFYYSIVEASNIPIMFPNYTFDNETMEKIEKINDSSNLIVLKFTFKNI